MTPPRITEASIVDPEEVLKGNTDAKETPSFTFLVMRNVLEEDSSPLLRAVKRERQFLDVTLDDLTDTKIYIKTDSLGFF